MPARLDIASQRRVQGLECVDTDQALQMLGSPVAIPALDEGGRADEGSRGAAGKGGVRIGFSSFS